MVMVKILPEGHIPKESKKSTLKLHQLRIDMIISTTFWKKSTISLVFLSLTSNFLILWNRNTLTSHHKKDNNQSTLLRDVRHGSNIFKKNKELRTNMKIQSLPSN